MHRPFDGTDRELAVKGGKASGAARRRKRDMREELEMLLSSRIKNADGKLCTRQEIMLASIVDRAMGGDLRAAAFVRDTLEGRPGIRIEVATQEKPEPLDVQVHFVSAKDGRRLEEHTPEELTEFSRVAFRGTPEEQDKLFSQWQRVEERTPYEPR